MDALTVGLSSPLSRPLRSPFAPGNQTLIQRAIQILRRFGPDAHLYLPGIGMLNGLTAGNYIDSAGTTAGVVGNPVGLVLDAAGGLGVELVTNGEGSDTTGWLAVNGGSIASVGGEFELTAGALGYPLFRRTMATTVGSTYLISVTARKGTTTPNLGVNFNGNALEFTNTAPTTKTSIKVASSTSSVIELAINGVSPVAGSTAYFDNISVREVTGIRAEQSLTGAKPRLERGLRNLLTWSGDFSNAAWSKVSVSASANTLTTLSPDHAIQQGFAVTPGAAYTFAFMARRGTMTDAKYSIYNLTGAADVVPATSYYSQLNSSEFTMVVVNFVAPAGSATCRVYPLRDSGATGTTLINGTALFAGTLTAAQIQANGGIPLTGAVAASNPDAGRYSWAFDGGDSLALGSVPFQMGDDHWVVLGVSVDNPPGEYGAALGFAGGTTAVLAALVNANGALQFRYKNDAATTFIVPLDSAYTPSTRLIASVRNVAGAVIARKNGVQTGSTNPTGVFTVTSAVIGMSPLGGVSLKGSTGPIAFGKGTISDADLLTIERAFGALNGVSI